MNSLDVAYGIPAGRNIIDIVRVDVLEQHEPPEAPYPAHYLTTVLTKDEVRVPVRPIKPEDAPFLVDFFNRLSKETISFRYLANLKSLPKEWLPHLTQVDASLSVAMVAVKEIESRERILGECRIMRKPGSTRGEIAATVEDQWQDKGLGTGLVRHCICIAKELGIKVIWGSVSSDNTRVFALADKLGFSCRKDPRTELFETELNLAADI